MDKATLSLLKVFEERHTLNLAQLAAILNVDGLALIDPIHYLMDLEYLRKGHEIEPLDDNLISFDTPLEITYKGLTAINQAENEIKQFKFTEFRAWATLLIAVSAFILSIINVLRTW